ncbi:MAG: aminodeoxychorismate/anthranilate synthase component II [Phycisphaerales bacterium]|jgi:anthranilate synthase/aminodeoxychorismate synthase-like glutamine amidotransferase|nr:aminodeoxychorismate/anthranilate synthase component II [Phycisphaerales bacterium]
MQIALVDNHDSFTWNLVERFRRIDGVALEVLSSSEVDVEALGGFDGIVFSPGPGIPAEQPAMFDILDRWAAEKAILGVCLGHQAIARWLGAGLVNLARPVHGESVELEILQEDALFDGLARPICAGLYHSWAVDATTLPPEVIVTAQSPTGRLMAMRHARFNVRGVQFHPESILTPAGEAMLRSWIAILQK